MPPTGTNEVPIYTPRSRVEHPSALFFSDRGGEGLVVLYLTSYAHKVFDGMPEPHYLSFLLSKLDLQAPFSSIYLSRFSGPSCPVPVFTTVDHPRRAHRWHHRGEPLVLIFFLKGKIYSYLYVYIDTCIIFLFLLLHLI